MDCSELVAIDIAILIEGEAAELALRFNTALWQQQRHGFRFDQTHLPHLTLLQQCTPRARLDEVARAIDAIVEGVSPLSLTITGAELGGSTSRLAVAPTAELQRLHERLADALTESATTDMAADSFFDGGEPPREGDIEWVRRFRDRSSHARFDPHITLGVGDVAGLEPDVAQPELQPLSFHAGRIGCCQLGRYCTCRLVLREWQLGSHTTTP